MTEKTAREPNYYGDIDKYGKFGEDLFISKHKDFMDIDDVRDNISYQRRDVDFIVQRKGSNDRWYCVEVKVDTRALDTGNLAYEVISHGCNGWSVITQADYVFMVLAKEDGDSLQPVKSLWIDMHKWKEYCSNRNTPKKMNIIQSESIVDLLCKIKDLQAWGVVVNTLDISKQKIV